MTLRKLFFSLLAVALLVIATGCDSSDDDEDSDAELFVGAWAAAGLTDGSGARSLAVSQFVATFAAETYGLDVVFTDQTQSPIQYSGANYAVNESTGTLTITIPAAVTGAGAIPVAFDYAFSNNNQTLALTVDDQTSLLLLNALFEPEPQYTAPLTITLSKQ